MLNIKKIREQKKLTQDELSEISGIKKRSLVDYENEKQDISLSKLQIIATALNVTVIELLGIEKEQEYHLIPLFDGVVTASMTGTDLSSQTEAVEKVNAGDWFRDATAAMRVHGDSMYPDYHSGSIVAMREVNNKRLVVYGQDYLIETSEYRVLKKIYPSENKECWLLCSTNSEIWETGPLAGKLMHPPQDVLIDDIVKIYQILGSVKRNHSSRVVQV